MERTVLITGASRGIGADAARLFAQEGWNVALGYCQSSERARALEEELRGLGFSAMAVRADVADREQVRRMTARVNARFGLIGALVNNAGVARQQLFTEITERDWDEIFAVNVKGAYHCAQAVVRQMIDAGGGSIVNVSSIWGVTGGSCEVHYSASKAALIGFTKALAKELGPSGIRVNCVAPGVIDTEMNAGLPAGALEQLREETPLGRLGTGRDVAEVIRFLSGEGASFLTGQVIGADGGICI